MLRINYHLSVSVIVCLWLHSHVAVDSYALIKVCSISDLKAVKTKICSVYKRSVQTESGADSEPEVILNDFDWPSNEAFGPTLAATDDVVDSQSVVSNRFKRLFKRSTQYDLLAEALTNAAAAGVSSSSPGISSSPSASSSHSLSSSGFSKLSDLNRALSKTNLGGKSKLDLTKKKLFLSLFVDLFLFLWLKQNSIWQTFAATPAAQWLTMQ